MAIIKSVDKLDDLNDFFLLRYKQGEIHQKVKQALEALSLGRTELSDYVYLIHENKIQAAALISKSRAPVIPRISDDISDSELVIFIDFLHKKLKSFDKGLSLHSDLSPEVELDSHKWELLSHEIVYSIDLKSDWGDIKEEDFLILDAKSKISIEQLNFIKFLTQEEYIDNNKIIENHIVILAKYNQKLIGCAIVVIDNPHFSTIHLAGILDEFRGRGWGCRLHRAALAYASLFRDLHQGTVDVNNTVMHKIMKSNGGKVMFSERYYRPK